MNKSALPAFDPAHDVLHYEHTALNVIFSPKNVAVIGATETPESVGRTLMWNLISNPFGGAVFPVNPKRKSVLGVKAYPKISAVPEQVDLAIIVIPAGSVPVVISECVEVGVEGAERGAGALGDTADRTLVEAFFSKFCLGGFENFPPGLLATSGLWLSAYC